MEKGDYLAILLKSSKTVFSFQDVVLLWRDPSAATRVRLSYFVKKGDLIRIKKGFYAKDENYDRNELAGKIFKPSYISFETILAQAGITFQYYSQIQAASYLTREISCDGQKYAYRKIKDIILTNKAGLEDRGEYWAASKERALLDTIYVKKIYYYDNLNPLDWDKVFEILPIYRNKRVEEKTRELFQEFKSNTALI